MYFSSRIFFFLSKHFFLLQQLNKLVFKKEYNETTTYCHYYNRH